MIKDLDNELAINYDLHYGESGKCFPEETIDHVCVSKGVHPREVNQFLGYNWEVESQLKCSKTRAD